MDLFQISGIPVLNFGKGSFNNIVALLKKLEYTKIVLFTGERSLKSSDIWKTFVSGLVDAGITFSVFSYSGEPSPEYINSTVSELRTNIPDAIVAVGGGSVIDAGKAVSAMLMENGSVTDFLEGVGSRTPSGRKIPFIAVPTTSGTGSEATKNAVISRIGTGGFKKSLRHSNYVPDYAVIDPLLTLSCPDNVTAASGLDAVTQLLEGYVSTAGNPFTRTLAESGLKIAAGSIEDAIKNGNDVNARGSMGYSSYLSGIVLANAGLGVIHGIAGAAGGLFPIPHGVICGTLLGSATRIIIKWLKDNRDDNSPGLSAYGKAGMIITGKESGSAYSNALFLVDQLDKWISDFKIPSLGSFGIKKPDLKKIAGASSLKNTPAGIDEKEILEILQMRL